MQKGPFLLPTFGPSETRMTLNLSDRTKSATNGQTEAEGHKLDLKQKQKTGGETHTKMLPSGFECVTSDSAALIQRFQTAPALTKPLANQIVSVVRRFVRAELWCADPPDGPAGHLEALWRTRSGQRKHNVGVHSGGGGGVQLLLRLEASCSICKTKPGSVAHLDHCDA